MTRTPESHPNMECIHSYDDANIFIVITLYNYESERVYFESLSRRESMIWETNSRNTDSPIPGSIDS